MGRQLALASDAQSIDFTSTALGVNWRGLKLTGWDGAAGTTLGVTQNPRGDGGWKSEAFLTPRDGLVLAGVITGDSAAVVSAAVDALNAAADELEATLTVTDDGIGARTMSVARQGPIIFTPQPTNLVKVWSIQMIATDPKKYGPVSSVSTALPSSSGGLTAAFTAPISIAATVVAGVLSFYNPGTVDIAPQFRIDGAASFGSPSLVHSAASGTHIFGMSGFALGPGDWLDIDMDPNVRTVLFDGQQSRDGYVTSRGWFALEPGFNDIAFAGDYDASALLTLTAPVGAWP